MTIENINILQNKFHLLLEQYLNGYIFSRTTKILFPLIKNIQTHSSEDLVCVINKIIGSEFKPKTNHEMANYLSKVYKLLLNIDTINSIEKEEKVSCKYIYQENNYQVGKRKILRSLINFLEDNNFYEYLDLFLIHGSYSTLDYEDNISDLDTLILIKDEILLSPTRLINLQEIIYKSFEYFYEIDLLQHHGYFILTRFDINYYNETFFPIMLFDYSTSVFQSKELFLFKIRNNDIERKQILDNTLNYIETTNPDNLNTLMEYKVYFQVIQLVPIAYLQYIGKNIYKKYSFDLFLKEFPQYKNFFNQIYDMRINWKQNNVKKYKALNILKNRHLLFLNSKIEKISDEKRMNLNISQYNNILKPMIKEIRNKLQGSKTENI